MTCHNVPKITFTVLAEPHVPVQKDPLLALYLRMTAENGSLFVAYSAQMITKKLANLLMLVVVETGVDAIVKGVDVPAETFNAPRLSSVPGRLSK